MALQKIANAFASADQSVRDQFMGMVHNLSRSRDRFFSRFFGDGGDTRRDIYAECGYPKNVTIDIYRDLFEREPIPYRVVTIFPDESWKNPPIIYEDDSPDTETEFEKAVLRLADSIHGKSWNATDDGVGNPINEALHRVDVMSGIGTFGILLLGLDDGKMLSEPVAGLNDRGESTHCNGKVENVLSPEFRREYEMGVDAQYNRPLLGPSGSAVKDGERLKLIYLKAYDESLVAVSQYETDQSNPRYGLPVRYTVTLHDPTLQEMGGNSGGAGLDTSTVEVHWTRVIHVADNRLSSDVFGVPRMHPVLNRLLDLRKLYAGSGEMYWRGAFPGYSLETNPQISPADVEIDEASLKDMMENYMNGFQRYFWTSGMTAKSLSPQVVDPSPQIERQLDAICIKLGIPKRKFIGSERGELSSADDESDWQKKVMGRKRAYLIPNVVTPFYDRLIAIGVLPCPEKGYKISWPDTDILSEKEKVALAEAKTRTMALYVTQSVESLMVPTDYLTKIMGFTDAEAQMYAKHAEKLEEERKQEELDMMQESMKQMQQTGGEETGNLPFSKGMPRPAEQLGERAKASTKPKTGPKSRRPMEDQPVKGDEK